MEIEESVMSLRKTVHYILIQTKKDRDNFKRDDLALAIKKLTKITDILAQVTNNAPPAMQCISTAKRLAFSAMKYLQVKHSGQNFIVQETEFKKDVGMFKHHYTLLLNYCEKTTGRMPDLKSSTGGEIRSKTAVTPHHSGSHHIKSQSNTATQSITPLKALSEPANNKIYIEKKSPEQLGSPPSENSRSANKVGSNIKQPSIQSPVPNIHISHNSRIRNEISSPSHYERNTPKTPARSEPMDEWDSIEKELLGTIDEDYLNSPAEKQNSSQSTRTSIVSDRSDLLELLLQQGLTPEMILNATEEELLLVLEKSLLSDDNPLPKTKRNSTQDLEDRLAMLEKQLLGDLF